MDVCDEAANIEALQLREALRIQKNANTSLIATGYCLYCGEPVKNGIRFCCKECRDDFEEEQKIKQRQGRA